MKIIIGTVFVLFAITANASSIKVYKVDRTLIPAESNIKSTHAALKSVVKHNSQIKIIAAGEIYQAIPANHKFKTARPDHFVSNVTKKIDHRDTNKISSVITKHNSRIYLSIMTGTNIAKVGKEQKHKNTKITYEELYDKYSPVNNYYSGVIAYGINGGYEFNIGSKALLSLGLGIYQNSNHTLKGRVYNVDGVSEHKFDYEYNIQSTRFMAETQLGWQFDLGNNIKIIPFVLFGIGPSLNFANNYEETPISDSSPPEPKFKSHMSTNLAYQLGVGISCPWGNNRLFATYRYADLGRAHFNENNIYPYQLDVGRIKSHEIYLGYTHLFDLW